MNKFKKLALMTVTVTCVLTVTALAAATLVSIPVSADVWWKGELSGPTTGKAGDTFTYNVQAYECSGLKPGETPSVPPGQVPGGGSYCTPLAGYYTSFSVADQSSTRGYGSSTDQKGHVSVGIPFPKAGVYQIAAGAPRFATNVITVTITAADNSDSSGGGNSGSDSSGGGSSGSGNSGSDSSGGGSSGSGNSGSDSSGGGSASPSPSTSSNNTAAVLGLEQVSASAGSVSSWMWILALGIIILLAIIVAVLLVTRRHPREEEYVPEDTSDYYRTGRR